ncbi:MAG: hypothetical protein LC769_11725 [Chloroflexi bacterium]|nr:hypothetical protein [Chloroflexota bacterium]
MGVIVVLVAVLTLGDLAWAQAPEVLSPTRFAALDAIYAAFAPFTKSASAANQAHARAVCLAVDRSDPLLAAQRQVCLLGLRELSSFDGLGTCQRDSKCSSVFFRLIATISQRIGADRASNGVVAAEVSAGPCRNVLHISRSSILHQQHLRRAIIRLVRAAIAGKPAAIKRAKQQISAILKTGGQGPHPDRRAAFARACAPVATPPSAATMP